MPNQFLQSRRKTIAVIGTGSLARAICFGLSTVLTGGHRIIVCGRSPERCREIELIAAIQAKLVDTPIAFQALPFTPEQDSAEDFIAKVQPDIIVNCNSYHSPWESQATPSGWTEFLRSAGFGATLPLQAAFAVKLAGAVRESGKQILFLNGCYPDAVNPVLKAMNLPIFCGIGNVGLFAAALKAAASAENEGKRVRVIGHHLHLHPIEAGVLEVQAWFGEHKWERVGELLAEQRSARGLERNKLIGFTAAILLRDLVSNHDCYACVPGPNGLPGGYPVKIQGEELTLDLPSEITEKTAIEWNRNWAVADGVTVQDSGDVAFSPRVETALHEHLPQWSKGFHVRELDAATKAMLEMRERLRAVPLVQGPSAM